MKRPIQTPASAFKIGQRVYFSKYAQNVIVSKHYPSGTVQPERWMIDRGAELDARLRWAVVETKDLSQ
jgi:hypothetical protein